MALGTKVAHPGSRVVCIVGDGGFGHTWQEVETAVRERLAVTVILLNNGIVGYQQHGEMRSYGSHTSATEFAPVDHAAIARACGAKGVRVTLPSELQEELAAAMDGETLTLLEVMIDPEARPPITKWDDDRDAKPALSALGVA